MYLFDWIARISAGIGVLFILLGFISSVTRSNVLNFASLINYFEAANTFFLITILLFLHNIKHKKE